MVADRGSCPPSSVFVEGKKISGSAQYLLYDGLLHHGTLLVNANLDTMKSVLRTDDNLARALGVVSSTPSPVANLSSLVGMRIGPEEVNDLLIRALTNVFEGTRFHGSLSKWELDMAHTLVETKYSDPSWSQPDFTCISFSRNLVKSLQGE